MMSDTHYLWVSIIFVIIVISNITGSWHLLLITHSQEFLGQQRRGDLPRSRKTCEVIKILIFVNSLVVCDYPLRQTSWWVQLLYQFIKGSTQVGLLTAYIPHGGVGRVMSVNFSIIMPGFVISTLGEGIDLCLWLPSPQRRDF